jgi:hypothetical protein
MDIPTEQFLVIRTTVCDAGRTRSEPAMLDCSHIIMVATTVVDYSAQ